MKTVWVTMMCVVWFGIGMLVGGLLEHVDGLHCPHVVKIDTPGIYMCAAGNWEQKSVK